MKLFVAIVPDSVLIGVYTELGSAIAGIRKSPAAAPWLGDYDDETLGDVYVTEARLNATQTWTSPV